jgi:hypothetical protein
MYLEAVFAFGKVVKAVPPHIPAISIFYGRQSGYRKSWEK